MSVARFSRLYSITMPFLDTNTRDNSPECCCPYIPVLTCVRYPSYFILLFHLSAWVDASRNRNQIGRLPKRKTMVDKRSSVFTQFYFLYSLDLRSCHCYIQHGRHCGPHHRVTAVCVERAHHYVLGTFHGYSIAVPGSCRPLMVCILLCCNGRCDEIGEESTSVRLGEGLLKPTRFIFDLALVSNL